MNISKSLYHGHCFPAGAISCEVRWYSRFQLSLRDIEELLFKRGVIVTSRRANASVASPKGTSFGACAVFATRSAHKNFSRATGRSGQHFALKRHPLRALLYRKQLAARFVAWREFAKLAENLPAGF
ncbi:MAG: integrase core domain protein [Candidatus Acidoferrum typicum]|nr:integrase core domain protein [Candidatus Acidoferrum typicum]